MVSYHSMRNAWDHHHQYIQTIRRTSRPATVPGPGSGPTPHGSLSPLPSLQVHQLGVEAGPSLTQNGARSGPPPACCDLVRRTRGLPGGWWRMGKDALKAEVGGSPGARGWLTKPLVTFRRTLPVTGVGGQGSVKSPDAIVTRFQVRLVTALDLISTFSFLPSCRPPPFSCCPPSP